MVEAAIVTPVFMLLIFGIFEFGFLLRNYLVVTSATTEAARAGSVFGADQDADFLVLQRLGHSLGPAGLQNLDFVVVYEASGPDDPVPPTCLVASSAASSCNRYTASDFFLPLLDTSGDPTGNFRCDTSAVDRYWCPRDREASLSATNGPDYLGIYVQYRHDYITGFFGADRQVIDQKIVRIEPESV